MDEQAKHISIVPGDRPRPLTAFDMGEMLERGASFRDVLVACTKWGCDLDLRLEPFEDLIPPLAPPGFFESLDG